MNISKVETRYSFVIERLHLNLQRLLDHLLIGVDSNVLAAFWNVFPWSSLGMDYDDIMAVDCLESGCIGLYNYMPSNLEISLGTRDSRRSRVLVNLLVIRNLQPNNTSFFYTVYGCIISTSLHPRKSISVELTMLKSIRPFYEIM